MVFEMANCGACKTCEIACCFHHTGEFGPSPTSFRVAENREGKGYLISISEEKQGDEVACDGCQGLDVPLCVEVCEHAEDLKKIISQFMQRK